MMEEIRRDTEYFHFIPDSGVKQFLIYSNYVTEIQIE